MSKNRGLTLIELLVTLSLMAILLALAVPAFQGFMLKRAVLAAAEGLASDLRLARAEAVKRGAPVTVCRSSDAASCAGSSGLWRDGWLVFADLNGNGALDAEDGVIRVQQAWPGVDSIAGSNPSTDLSRFTYQSTGWAKAVGQTFIVTPAGGSSSLARLLCISLNGRPSLRPEGSVPPCS